MKRGEDAGVPRSVFELVTSTSPSYAQRKYAASANQDYTLRGPLAQPEEASWPVTMEEEIHAEIETDPDTLVEQGTAPGLGDVHARVSAEMIVEVGRAEDEDEVMLESTTHEA